MAYDELILALDLYLSEGQLDVSHPKVIDLSHLLKTLPIHTNRPNDERFRNPNAVALKLANFRSLDKRDSAKGYKNRGKSDKLVWNEFFENRSSLKEIANAIRASGPHLNNLTPEEGEDDSPEGKLLYRMHRSRERNSKIVKEKKKSVRDKYGSLECEVCGFDFSKSYGDHGTNFIECHHRIPLCSVNIVKTKLKDLALVCANCHRMLHRGKPWPSVKQLKAIISKP